MAARKLQTEIERTLKKVAEGVEIFEGIFDKIQTSTNQTQKEKLEVDLKSQIKKLQRLRDQIKTWMQSNDIKDKQPLMDNRKLIETQMERFKACEKEMKTKAFSKEGLSAAAKLDPREQLKVELCSWITTMVDELSRQVEQTEAEVETLQLAKKKKNSGESARLEELESLNERRSWHIGRLELILRLLENGNLQTEAVADVKDDIAYFVESNTEEDFEEDEGIYDELNLEEEEDLYQLGAGDDMQSSHDSQSVADDEQKPAPIPVSHASSKTPAKEPPRNNSVDEKSPSANKTKPAPAPVAARKPTIDSNTPRPIIITPGRSVSGPGPVPRTVPAQLPPIRYATAAAAANTSAPPPAVSPTSATAPISSASLPLPTVTAPIAHALSGATHNASPTTTTATAPTTDPSPLHAATSSPELSKSTLPETTSQAVSSAAPSPLVASRNMPNLVAASPAMSSASVNGSYSASSGPPSTPSAGPSISSQSLSQPQSQPPVPSQLLDRSPRPTASALPLATVSEPLAEMVAQPIERSASPAVPTSAPADKSSSEPRLPSTLADLVTSFESAKQKSMRREHDLNGIHKILDAGFSNVPQPLDAEKPKYYVPRNTFATPSYYPQEPAGHFANPALFAKLDVDTLFYIFYYCQGTYLQYLAASELKKQSWRFHKQYLTWFQRANEPQQITDEYEQGVYLYFDWEGSWCQRRKSDFKFEYRYLETE